MEKFVHIFLQNKINPVKIIISSTTRCFSEFSYEIQVYISACTLYYSFISRFLFTGTCCTFWGKTRWAQLKKWERHHATTILRTPRADTQEDGGTFKGIYLKWKNYNQKYNNIVLETAGEENQVKTKLLFADFYWDVCYSIHGLIDF